MRSNENISSQMDGLNYVLYSEISMFKTSFPEKNLVHVYLIRRFSFRFAQRSNVSAFDLFKAFDYTPCIGNKAEKFVNLIGAQLIVRNHLFPVTMVGISQLFHEIGPVSQSSSWLLDTMVSH